MHSLSPLFRPHVIAVLGASDRYGSTGRTVFGQLHALHAAEQIIPINTIHKTIGGMKAYASLTELTEELVADTAVVILSADKLPNIVREASKNAVKNIIIINDLEQATPHIRSKLDKASELAEKANIRLLAVTTSGMEGLFSRNPNASCAYIGQSAGIADCMLSYAKSRGMAFSRFITLNPQQNDTVSTGQVLDFIATEAGTDAVLVHISTLDNTRELLSALTAASRRKPVFVLNTLPEGEQENLFNQALERNKIFTVQTLSEFLTVARLLHTGVAVNGRRIGIISNTPQISALSLKALPQMGLELAHTSASTTRTLSKILPHKLPSTNPLYVSADTAPSVFQTATELFLQDDQMDAVCLIYAGSNTTESRRTAQMVGALQASYPRKPLFMAWLGSADNEETRTLLNENKNLHFRQPELALDAFVQLNRYRDYRNTRHYTTSFYDYRNAANIAETVRGLLNESNENNYEKSSTSTLVQALDTALGGLQRHLRSNRTIANELTDKIFSAFKIKLCPQNTQTQCTLTWDNVSAFGQVLTLAVGEQSAQMLPPITPNVVAKALHHLNLPPAVWQGWLLETADVLCRLPEIATFQIALHHESKTGLCGHSPKIQLAPENTLGNAKNVFTPYPFEAEEFVLIKNGKLFLRPIRPEDADLVKQHVALMSDESREMRFISKSKELPPALLAHLTSVDYSREFAILLHDEQLRPLAMANYTADEFGESCEFGISLLDEVHGRGVGVRLMERLIARAKLQKFKIMRAEILSNNHAMQKLALKLGFTLSKHPNDPSMVEASLDL